MIGSLRRHWKAAAAGAGPVAGGYRVGPGSIAGYRVNEVLAGQHTTAVGRTTEVTESMTIAGDRVTTASFAVQMGSVTSDRSQRDGQFSGRIIDVAQFPTGSFTLTKPTGIQVSGTTTIDYGHYGIDNPSFGGFVSVGNSGAFEVLLNLVRI